MTSQKEVCECPQPTGLVYFAGHLVCFRCYKPQTAEQNIPKTKGIFDVGDLEKEIKEEVCVFCGQTKNEHHSGWGQDRAYCSFNKPLKRYKANSDPEAYKENFIKKQILKERQRIRAEVEKVLDEINPEDFTDNGIPEGYMPYSMIDEIKKRLFG